MAGRYPKQNWQSGNIISPYGPLGGARMQHIEDWLATIFDNHDAVIPLSPIAGGLFFNSTSGLWENRLLKDADVDGAAGIQASKIVGLPASEQTGVMKLYGGSIAPSGYVLCQGQAKKRSGVDPDGTNYAALFAVIATSYGVGDGSTTFNLPDCQGRVLVGKGTHADVSALGNSDGLAVANRRPKHKHTVATGTLATGNDTPDHTHTYNDQGFNAATFGAGAAGAFATTLGPVASGGASVRHTHPVTGAPTVGPQTGAEPTDSEAYVVVNVIIKL